MHNTTPNLSQLDFLFSKISEGFAYCKIITDADGKPVDWVYLDVNNAYERINGVKKEDVIGRKVTEVIPDIAKDPADWISFYGNVALKGEPTTIERYSEARKKWYHVSAYSPQKEYFISIFEDITERKKSEEESKKAKEDWERTFDAVPDLVAILDTNYRIVRANKAMATQLAINPKEALDLICYQRIHGTTSPPDNCPHAQLLKDGKQHIAEVHEPRLGGDFVVSATPLRDEQGRLIGSVHVAHNITVRKKAEEALKQSEEKYRSLFINMIDGFAHCQMVYDKQGKPIDFIYLDVNDAFEKLTGLKKETVLGKKVSEAIPGTLQANPEIIDIYGRVASTGQAEHFEVYFKPLSLWFSISVYSPQKGYFIALFENITERKNSEETLKKLNLNLEGLVHKRTAEVVNERQRLYNVLETLPVYVVLLDKDYHVPFANKFFRERFGESHGKRCFEYLFNRSSSCGNCETYKVLKSKMPQHWEWTGPDGHTYDIYDFPFVESDGSNLILEMGIDITERKLAEKEVQKYREHLEQLVKSRTEQLRQSEQRWSTTLSSIGDAVIATDTNGEITFMNPVAEALTGWRLQEAKQKSIKQVFHIVNEKTRKEVESPVKRVLENGLIAGLANHTLLIRKDGTEVPIDDSGAPIVAENGVIQGVVLVFRDITERKKAEQALAESEERLKRSQEIAHLGSWELDLKEDRLTWSDEVYRIFGLKPQEFEATYEAFLSYVHPDDRAAVDAAYANSVREGKDGYEIEHRVVRHDNGETRFVHEKATHIRDKSGKIVKSLGMVQDITENRLFEDALKRQAALIDLSPNAILVRKFDGTITFWSKGAEKLYGWTKEEAVGKLTHQLLGTRFPQPFDDVVAELKNKGGWTGEVTQKTKKGQEVVAQSWWRAEQTEHGEVKSILESNVDLTERKKAEKEIARLASYPTMNPNPVVEITTDGKITYANPATKKLFPTLESDGLNHLFFCNWELAKKAFEDRDKNTQTYSTEVKINGHWYHQHYFFVPQTQLIRIYTTDIDELKQTEEARARAQKKLEENAVMLEEYASQMEELAEQRAQQLQNAERMAAIGQTAGMVGHDIRNPLQAITSDMYLISEEIKSMKDDECKQSIMESVDSVNQNLGYINKIVSDLQDYTRPLKPNFQDANLAELIEGALLTVNVPKGIEATTNIRRAAKPIKTDIAYMRRILTNLMTNAVQAMQDQGEGKLTVEATRRSNVVTVTVQDTGVGIPEEVRPKMFTPLFTTKSKGQGLGLAVVKRLVDALKGTISFESEPGKGTKFTVEFPQENSSVNC